MLYNNFKLGILHSCIFILNVGVIAAQYPDAPPNINVERSVRITRSVIPSLENTFINTNSGDFGNNNLQSTSTNSASTSVFSPPNSNGFAAEEGPTIPQIQQEPTNLQIQQEPTIPQIQQEPTIASEGPIYLPTNTADSATLDLSPSPSTSIPSLPSEHPSKYDYLNIFAKAVLSNPAMQKYLNVKLSGPEASTILFNVAYRILGGFGDPKAFALATLVGEKAAPYKVFTIPLYFDATGNTLEKFLIFEGTEVVSSLADCYAKIIAESVALGNVIDSFSLYNSILNGFVAFIQSLGYDFEEKAEILTYIFNTELGALQNSGIY